MVLKRFFRFKKTQYVVIPKTKKYNVQKLKKILGVNIISEKALDVLGIHNLDVL